MAIEELSSKELEQVYGGFSGQEVTEIRYNFTEGDTFKEKAGNFCYMAIYNYNLVAKETDVKVKWYFYRSFEKKYEYKGITSRKAGELAEGCNYVGSYIIGSDDIYYNDNPIAPPIC